MSDETNENPAPERVIGTPAAAPAGKVLVSDDEAGPVEAGFDIDESKAKKAERIVALLFLLAFAAGVGFMVYFIGWSGRDGGMHGIERTQESNLWLGSLMTLSFLAMAAGVTVWFRRLMTSVPIEQERHDLATAEATRASFARDFQQGTIDSGFTKRPLLRRTLLLAAAPLGLAPLFLLRDLGPLPEKRLRSTWWGEAVAKAKREGKQGVRIIVDGTNVPLRASDFNSPGGMITVLPEGIHENGEETLTLIAKATTILINIEPELIKPVEGRENWTVNGIVAYSKVCTHVGCPAALYEQTTHHILCPCHQSTFDATDGAKVVFGPAARALPQLPIAVDDEGYLIATGDYPEPVGPSFWERG
ncbi:Rieske 2Fe-2S domain-containing protein [Actinocorallia sp. API 0066]|uniref:cytochrome bc1 complex Rieske iron-sulfur subunit n=1 Tax=Actinocorallia sp. API 0066 TaxID=2896846 RepID=UPI001E5A1F84|nr:Rieske 2Fe-2S domain-containing protein [Actinocorallia sp. API 0066]MCD0450991.1 Rieske 2Fe-2S domain-containing protein [Actinocorallia sp. API 0066]